MSTFENANKMLRQLVDADVLQPEPGRSLEQITETEKKYGFILPPPIVEWLTYCGGISMMAHGVLYGLDEITDDFCSEHTSHWKKREWTPIGGDGCGSYYLVVKREERVGTAYPPVFIDRYPVVFVDHEDSAIEEDGESRLCNHITYMVASDLPHFLEAIFLYQEHGEQYRDCEGGEYPDFWWPFDKTRVRQFDPDIEKIGIIAPWDAYIESIRDGVDRLLQKGDRETARKQLLKAVELAKEDDYVCNEMVSNIDALAENGFIRDALNVIRNLPPSYERAHSFCYITFCKSEHFDCTPEEVVETAIDIAEEGFNMRGGALPPDKCDRYFAHYVDDIFVLINTFSDERNLKNAETYLDRLWQLVRRLTDPMDRILSFNSISLGFCCNGNYNIAKIINDEAMAMVGQADANLWDEWEFYDDDPLTRENVLSWVEGVKKEIDEKMAHDRVTIEKIVKGSNEAAFQELVLHNNCLTMKVHLPYYGQSNYGNNGDDEQEEMTVTLKIKAEVFDVQMPDTFPLTAHFCLDRINIMVNSWGYYILPENKDEFFWLVKNGFALAFGRHHQKYRWLFRIVFGEGHVHVLLSDPNDIDFIVMENDE
ncbi:MAG: SMI1/KNR4 family protein [Planctomycetaceae bacterium]|nr:SMI1/KNR4 family protein [Planctomycetaceae bacterium]